MQELLEKKVLKNNIRIIDLLFALAITVLSIYARVNFGEFRSVSAKLKLGQMVHRKLGHFI